MAIIKVRPDVSFRVLVVKGDTPTLHFQVFDLDNTKIDISAAVSLFFSVDRGDGVLGIDQAGAIVSGTDGLVDFVLSAIALELGTYNAEISGTFPSSVVRTFAQGKLIVSEQIKS